MQMSCWVSELDKLRIVGPVGYSQMVRKGRVFFGHCLTGFCCSLMWPRWSAGRWCQVVERLGWAGPPRWRGLRICSWFARVDALLAVFLSSAATTRVATSSDVERMHSSARVVWKSNKGEARLENELQESNDAIGSGFNCQPVNALVSESKMKLAAVKSLMNCRLWR